MPDYSHLAPGDYKIEETADNELWVHRSVAGWSEELRWKAGREPLFSVNERTVRERMLQGLAANTTYLALANPTAAQNTAQIRRLTRQSNGLMRMLLATLEDVSDT